MKIAIICYNHFDATISLAKYLGRTEEGLEINLIFLLSQSFMDVEIISLKGKGIKNGFIEKGLLRKVIDKEIFDYLSDKIGFEIFLFNSYKMADLKNFKLLFELRTAILDRNYDVIHFVGNHRWIILLNFLLRKIPKVHTIHEPYLFDESSRYRLFRHQLKVKLLIWSKSHLIVPSVISFKRFTDHYPVSMEQLSIIPFGPMEIYKQYSSNQIVKQTNVALYFGNISPYKGIEILVSAMQLISRSNPNLRVIIAGAGQLDLGKLIDLPNLEIINRHLSNKEIAALNQLATIVVCPYTSASQSGVVMTAFAFDNPVVATNVAALPEFVEDGVTGVIIEPNDPQMLHQAVTGLFKDMAAIEKMRKNIHLKYAVSEKSWSGIARQTLQLYTKQIMAKKANITH